MDPALSSATAPTPVAFEDGLGTRRLDVDRSRNETVEMLCLRGELAGVPSFEFALRERLSHLAAFSHACYGRVRSVERLKDPASTLALVSDVTAGMRLSEILRFAEAADVTLDIDAALCLLRQLVPAVAMLHENMPDIALGAIGPEPLIVTPGARLIVVEHVMGSALEQLRFSQERYWHELRIAVPRSAGLPRFDHRADVTQLGVVALSLILGRRLQDDEGPSRLGDLVSSAWAGSARGGLEPLPAGLRSWLIVSPSPNPGVPRPAAVQPAPAPPPAPLHAPAPEPTPAQPAAHAPAYTPPPAAALTPPAAPVFTPAPAAVRREPAAIAAPLDLAPRHDEMSDVHETSQAPSMRQRWPLVAAAVAVLAVVAAGVPVVKRWA